MGRKEVIGMEDIKRKSFGLDLSNYSKFKMASFERKVRDVHVKNLKGSIKREGLLKKDITIWENGTGEYHVLDGQHRLMALNQLLEEGHKKSFMIDLFIMPGMDGIAAKRRYLEINTIIRVLSPHDILKVFDDGKNPFFSGIGEFCNHYGDMKHVAFIQILQAFKYAKAGGGSMRKDEIAEWAICAEKWEIERMKLFMENLTSVFPYDTSMWMYRYVIFRNLFKIYWDYFEQILPKLPRFFRIINDDKFLANNSKVRTNESLSSIYDHMKKLLEKIGVKD